MNTLIAAALVAAAPVYQALVGTNVVYTSETKPVVERKIEKNAAGKRQLVSTLKIGDKTVYGPVINRIIRVRDAAQKKPAAKK